MLYLTEGDVEATLSDEDALSCVEKSFRLLSDGSVVNAVRQRSFVDAIVLNVMWAIAPTEDVLAIKCYPVVRTEAGIGPVPNVLLHSTRTGELLAAISASALGRIRTAAASAVATKHLAREDAGVLSVFGTGFQAEAQLVAIARVMPNLTTVLVVGRDEARRDEFIRNVSGLVGAKVSPATAVDAARRGEVIVTATRSSTPVVDGEWVSPGVHINAVGSNVATNCELERNVLERASVIAVDEPAVAAAECGDLLANGWSMRQTVALGDVINGISVGRRSPLDVTIFESQGVAIQDALCAAHVYEACHQSGRGQVLKP